MVIAKVSFDYIADQPDELTLKVGDIVTNIKVEDGGWWEGELNGKCGMFPENFVEIIEDSVKSPAPTLPVAKPTVTATSKKKFARVTFQYEAAQPDELNLNVGDLVEIIEEEDEGWWKGKLNEKVGMFPSNFVEAIVETAAPSEHAVLPEPIEPVPASPPAATPNDIKSNRPKSQVGLFGVSIGDLSRDKLKKTGKSVGGSEPPPPAKPSKPVEPEKKTAPPLPAAPKEMTKSVLKAKVLFNYDPEQGDELKLSVGEIITIVNKDIFEGWMQGENNGKIGLFPENFVETLPMETVKVEESLEGSKPIVQQKSVKRAAKANPTEEKPPEPIQPEKPKFGMGAALGGGIQAELQKKLAAGKAPGPPLKPTKANKPPGPPAKPTKPKPPTTHKPETPPSPITNRTGSVSRHEENSFMKRTTSESRKNPPKPPPPVATLPQKTEPEQTPKIKDETDFDLDAVKPSDQLKHMQRAKPPSKNPPSKFKNDIPEASGESNGADSKEVVELKKQVKDLQEKMSDLEKKFQKLTKQVFEDLAVSNKEQRSQQIDIGCLKKQVEILTK